MYLSSQNCWAVRPVGSFGAVWLSRTVLIVDNLCLQPDRIIRIAYAGSVRTKHTAGQLPWGTVFNKKNQFGYRYLIDIMTSNSALGLDGCDA
jgi:hypothetical protein